MLLIWHLFVLEALLVGICDHEIDLGALIGNQMGWLFVQELLDLPVLDLVKHALEKFL